MATFDEVFKAAETVVHYTVVSNLSENIGKLAEVLKTYDGDETEGVVWTATRMVESKLTQVSSWIKALDRALIAHRRENGI